MQRLGRICSSSRRSRTSRRSRRAPDAIQRRTPVRAEIAPTDSPVWPSRTRQASTCRTLGGGGGSISVCPHAASARPLLAASACVCLLLLASARFCPQWRRTAPCPCCPARHVGAWLPVASRVGQVTGRTTPTMPTSFPPQCGGTRSLCPRQRACVPACGVVASGLVRRAATRRCDAPGKRRCAKSAQCLVAPSAAVVRSIQAIGPPCNRRQRAKPLPRQRACGPGDLLAARGASS